MFASWTDQRQAQHSRVHQPAPRPWQDTIEFGPQDVAVISDVCGLLPEPHTLGLDEPDR